MTRSWNWSRNFEIPVPVKSFDSLRLRLHNTALYTWKKPTVIWRDAMCIFCARFGTVHIDRYFDTAGIVVQDPAVCRGPLHTGCGEYRRRRGGRRRARSLGPPHGAAGHTGEGIMSDRLNRHLFFVFQFWSFPVLCSVFCKIRLVTTLSYFSITLVSVF